MNRLYILFTHFIGDFYPTTVAGKIVATAAMHMGVLVLALPVTIIGANFAVEMEAQKVPSLSHIFLTALTASHLTGFHETLVVRVPACLACTALLTWCSPCQ